MSNVNTYVVAFSGLRCRKNRRENRRQINRTTTVANVTEAIRVGYNLNIMGQSESLVLNPITVNSYGFLFNCTTVGQASDSMTALT